MQRTGLPQDRLLFIRGSFDRLARLYHSSEHCRTYCKTAAQSEEQVAGNEVVLCSLPIQDNVLVIQSRLQNKRKRLLVFLRICHKFVYLVIF
jgi:hypothetical protein